jgi:hypothetical protein
MLRQVAQAHPLLSSFTFEKKSENAATSDMRKKHALRNTNYTTQHAKKQQRSERMQRAEGQARQGSASAASSATVG